jgi:hypothetical protein
MERIPNNQSKKERCKNDTGSHNMKIKLQRLYTWTSVLQGEVFILKLVAIDGLSTSAIVVREVTTLAHELRDDTVERGSLEAKTTLAGAESAEIFSSARHYVGTQLTER